MIWQQLYISLDNAYALTPKHQCNVQDRITKECMTWSDQFQDCVNDTECPCASNTCTAMHQNWWGVYWIKMQSFDQVKQWFCAIRNPMVRPVNIVIVPNKSTLQAVLDLELSYKNARWKSLGTPKRNFDTRGELEYFIPFRPISITLDKH